MGATWLVARLSERTRARMTRAREGRRRKRGKTAVRRKERRREAERVE